MNEGNLENEMATWTELANSYKRYTLAHQAFFDSASRVALIRRALHTSDRLLAVSMAEYLTPDEHMQLFDEWVRWSRAVGCLPAVRDYILSLPREWVLKRIEEEVKPYLLDGGEDDFRRYLELYYALDPGLTAKLAQQAVSHPDSAIQEAGNEFLLRLEEDRAHAKD